MPNKQTNQNKEKTEDAPPVGFELFDRRVEKMTYYQ